VGVINLLERRTRQRAQGHQWIGGTPMQEEKFLTGGDQEIQSLNQRDWGGVERIQRKQNGW